MIILQNISKNYGNEFFTTEVLKDVSLTIEDRTTVAIVGKSGAGKSTLLNIMCGLDVPTSGTICIDEVNLNQLSPKKLSDFRLSKFGFVFQDFQLVSTLTALDNIVLPSLALKGAVDNEWLEKVISITGLQDRLGNYPGQLSGGERQRVAIARAIINRPGVLFADEPTGNLDSENTEFIMNFLREYAKENGCTFIFVTHDADLCKNVDRILEIKEKNVFEKSNVKQA